MSKTAKKIAGYAAPLAGFIPGLQPLAAVGLGAGLGALSGGGLKAALAGGLGSAIPGYSGQLGSALGATGATAGGLGGGLLGAGAGAASGGLKGALLGGAGGGLGGYYNAGGFDGLGESLGVTGPGSLLGESGVSGQQLPWQTPNGTAGAQLPWQQPSTGSGVLGSISKATGGIPSTISGTGAAGGSTYGGSALSSALGGVLNFGANQQAEDDLLAARQSALAKYQPYVDSEFAPGDLTQTPGYKFRLEQGTDAINKSLGARGKVFSGEALKAAQDYGTGLADSTYNTAYNQWLANKQANVGIAGNMANLDLMGGQTQALEKLENTRQRLDSAGLGLPNR